MGSRPKYKLIFLADISIFMYIKKTILRICSLRPRGGEGGKGKVLFFYLYRKFFLDFSAFGNHAPEINHKRKNHVCTYIVY